MVMDALTTVLLAATVWQDWGDQWGADPVGLVDYVVRGLGEKGLLTYRVTPGAQGRTSPGERDAYANLAHTIRLTPQGWALMGYPNVQREAGRRSGLVMHDPDKTNHWSHPRTAEGGAIERLPWDEHRATYPDHRHPSLAEAQGEDMNMQTAAHPSLAPAEEGETRGYIRVTPELEARVVAMRAREPLSDYATIAEYLSLPERTVKYVLSELPGLRRSKDVAQAEASLKQRILWTLDVSGGR